MARLRAEQLIAPVIDQPEAVRIGYVPAAGVTVSKFDILYVSGTSRRRYELSKADADSVVAATGTLLLALGDTRRTTEGDPTGVAVPWGLITEQDTSALSVGDPVYLSSTAGGWSATPVGFGRRIGTVIKSDATDGRILFRPVEPDGSSVIEGEILAAAVQTLNATPVEVIPAPGAGKFTEVDSCLWMLDHQGADYDDAAAGEDLALKYTDAAGAKVTGDVDHSGFADASADAFELVKGVQVTPVANAAVVAHILSGEWYSAAGDGILRYRIRFYVHDALA